MVKILGKMYFIDLDSIMEVCEIVNKYEDLDVVLGEDGLPLVDTHGIPTNENKKDLEINVFKFDTINKCIDILLHPSVDDIDENLGGNNVNKLSIPYKIAFNTLLKYGVLNEQE